MALEHSYKITISNNKTEQRALDYLIHADSRFLIPTKESRKHILEILKLPSRYSRAFDLFTIPGHTNTEREIVIKKANTITLIELKTTQKYLPHNPSGFFFGATQNEFNLAKRLGKQYKFCFVSLHSNSPNHQLLTYKELEKRMRNKRIQFQIQLS